MGNNAYIKAISYYLPQAVITNEELAELYNGWDGNKILNKTGIYSRHISGKDEYISDLAEKAALQLFGSYNINPATIDFIILCTQSPDYILPATSCVLQEKLKIPVDCGAFDINLGCSGFVYGLALTKSLIFTGVATNILLIMSETYTKHIHPMDKSTRTIFGDGAAAALISGGSEERIGQFILGTDGKGAQHLIIPSGGQKIKRNAGTSMEVEDESGNIRSQENLFMDGPEVFNFTISTVPDMVRKVMQKNSVDINDIDLFVFHQANKFMLEYLRNNLNIPSEKFYINMLNIGNTVSASIPIALKMAEEQGILNKGDTVLLAGFGVGYSWGATVIRW